MTAKWSQGSADLLTFKVEKDEFVREVRRESKQWLCKSNKYSNSFEDVVVSRRRILFFRLSDRRHEKIVLCGD
jgi:hypothetical protein